MSLSDNKIRTIIDLSKSQIEEESSWMQNIVLMASSLLGLLVALNKTPSTTELLHQVYIFILCLIGTGILSGVIYLYMKPNMAERLRKKYVKNIGNPDRLTVVEPYKIFHIMRWISCVCFFISIPALIWYAILMDSVPS